MSDLWVVTTYFNPCGYATRRINYERFIAGLTAVGVPCMTVECAFDGEPFELPPSEHVMQLRGDVLWQKERLLNLGAAALPKACKYVAWIDADVLFMNPDWAEQTKRVLQDKVVAQLFTSCMRLDQAGNDTDDIAVSFGAIASADPSTINTGRYDVHGHTGYAWAMRREIFDEVGLYEHSVVGSSDHFMAHAIYGVYGFCVENALKQDAKQLNHLYQWGSRFYELVQGSFGVVPGRLVHLWHGDLKNRRYFLRMHDVTDLGFDPATDVCAEQHKPLMWTATGLSKPGLAQYFYNYFAERQEDGAYV